MKTSVVTRPRGPSQAPHRAKRVPEKGAVLSAARQRELLRAYQETGDLRAKQALVEANLGLVYSIVGSVLRRHEQYRSASLQNDDSRTIIDKEDLKQEAAKAFTSAVDGYDPKRGSLGAYAGEAVRHVLYDELEHSRFIPGRAKINRWTAQYLDARDCIRRTEGREAGRDEAARLAGMSEYRMSRVEDALLQQQAPLVIEDVTHRDGGGERRQGPSSPSVEEEMSASQDEVERGQLLWALGGALTDLGEIDRAVLEDLFGLGGRKKMTAVAVAAKMGLCRQRVYQIRSRAFQQLRAVLTPSPADAESAPETADTAEALSEAS